MKFLMLVQGEPDLDLPPETDSDVATWVKKVDEAGSRIIGDRLAPPTDSVVVRVRDGAVLRTDGPFAEAREFIGGFDILEAPDMDAAVAIAAEHPLAAHVSLEIRPFWPLFPEG
ncbi:YciI family protein [Mumia sp. DW29H23]|uniref:YciI family protein n=1 Tax=Mumia sp. DW29H23 TaxID=3421241 RepID=UPI003D68EE19